MSQSKMKDIVGGITEDKSKEASKEVQSGPNLFLCLNNHSLLHVYGPEGWVGAYSPNICQLH